MEIHNEICTVIVTYNRLELLKQAVSAIIKQTVASDILVINNGSTDGTYEYLQESTGINVIHQENLGGAGGFHRGMKWAVEKGYKFVWIMDDDVEPYNDALEQLLYAYNLTLKAGPVGFICSTVLDTDGETANHPYVDFRETPKGFPEWNRFLEECIVKVSHATFVSVFIPTKNIIELGLPYKEFFIWGDDTEYTGRLSGKYSSYLAGKSKVNHYRVGGQINLVTLQDKNRIKMMRYYIRNEWFNNSGGIKKFIHNCRRNMKLISRLIKARQFSKIKIVVKGATEGMKFNPKIDYPNIEC